MRLRENRVNLGGRSLPLNVVSIILNVIGVFFIAKGFHISSGDSGLTFKMIGFITFALGFLGLFLLKGMHMFSFVARAFVGGLFIVSGLVKANDPWGFAFKLEEYFSPMGLTYDFPFFEIFHGFELEMSVVVCVAEIVLGVAVIVGGRIKLASWLLLVMMISFTVLTYYTYSCVDTNALLSEMGQLAERDCVTDCGCFGDALRGSVGRSLTPYETFWKDIVLMYFVLVIFMNQWKITMNTALQNWVMIPAALLVVIFFSWVFGWYFPIFFYLLAVLGSFIFGNMNIGKLDKAWKMAIYVSVISTLFGLFTIMYLPIKDYRAYAIGNNIKTEMNKGEAEISTFSFIYKNIQSGEEKKFDQSEFDVYGDKTKWEYVDRVKTVLKAGVDAPISDFLLTADYASFSKTQLENKILDSIAKWDFESYYETKIVRKSNLGVIDTISDYEFASYYFDTSAVQFDTVFYTKENSFSGLMDPTTPYMMDVTEYILTLEDVILITIRDIDNINIASIENLKSIYTEATKNDIPFYILSPAMEGQINEFKTEFDFDAPFLSMDGIEIKIIVRSNPGVVLLQNATVTDKWPSKSIPSFEYIQTQYLK
jgi:uncharacterized membrane protein YphA (DoxX/SURF4 family)